MRRPAAILSSCALLAALALAAAPLRAMEKASAQMERERPTSAPDAVSLKPLALFSMRGRPDPFMAYPILTNITPVKLFDVDDLTYSGTLEVDGKVVGMFNGTGGKTYLVRGSKLYDPQNKPVDGIRCAISEHDDMNSVVLLQGERKLVFTSKRASKRLAATSPR
jgi:hypothetical protein